MNITGNSLRKINIALIVLAVVLCVVAAVLSLSPPGQGWLPAWVQARLKPASGSRVLTYRLDRAALEKRRMDALAADLSTAFASEGIADTKFTRDEPGVLEIALDDPINLKMASKVVDRFKTREFDIQTTPEGQISLTYSTEALNSASRFAIARFVSTGGIWGSLLDDDARAALKINKSGEDSITMQLPDIATPEETSIGVAVEEIPAFSINWVRDVQDLKEKLDEEEREVQYDRASGGIADLLGDQEDAETDDPGDQLAINIPEGTFIAHDVNGASPRYLLEEPAIVTGEGVALAQIDGQNAGGLEIILSPEGQLALTRASKDNETRQMALVLDHMVFATFSGNGLVSTGKLSVQQDLSADKAEDIVEAVNLSAPAPEWILVAKKGNHTILIALGLALALIALVLIYLNVFKRQTRVSNRE